MKTQRRTFTHRTLKNLVASTVLATCAALGATAPAFASGAPTVTDPGGIAAATSPDGVPIHSNGPEFHTFAAAQLYASLHPGTAPSGTNDFDCQPAAGQRPIVLIPGTVEDAFDTWSLYGPHLAAAGYCVFTFNYNPQLDPITHKTMDDHSFGGDIRQSAAFLAGFVDRVLTATGADKVNLIGHSQGGGPLPRAYLKWYGGAAKVDQLIALVPSNHGTTAYGISTLYNALSGEQQASLESLEASMNLGSLSQQLRGSSLITDLNAGSETMPGVRYTIISTTHDQVVLPYTSAFINAAGVTNITVQHQCVLDGYTHLNFTYDPVAYQDVVNALDPAHATPVNCWWIPPYLG